MIEKERQKLFVCLNRMALVCVLDIIHLIFGHRSFLRHGFFHVFWVFYRVTMAENPAEVANTVMQFSLMQSLKTGNPILDMMLSCVLLSVLGYILTNFSQKKDQLLRWLTRMFIAQVLKSQFSPNLQAKGELKFFGEEYHDTWGDVHRRYPETFRAILHHIDVNKCQGVNAYEV